MTPMRLTIPQKAYLAVAATSFIWGSTWVASKLAVGSVPGLQISAIRQLLAGSLFILYFKLKGHPWPNFKQLRFLFTVTFFLLIIGNGFATWGIKFIPSGLAALIGALYPMCVVMIEKIFFKTRTTLFTLAGLVLGFAGIGIVFYNNRSFGEHGSHFTMGVAMALLATLGWSIGTIFIARKKFELNTYYSMGWQMLLAAPCIYSMALLTGNHIPIGDMPAISWALLCYLVLAGSCIAFICFIYSMKHLPVAIASLYAYINPFVAMLIGSALLNERLTLLILTGTVITLAGVYLVNKSLKGHSDLPAENEI